MHVYLDNAATTPIDPEVIKSMEPYLSTYYGNPSSIHEYGRKGKAAIEKVRKQIAALLHTSPAEIFFTASGTEANNMAISGSIMHLGIQHAITSPLEHQAIIEPLRQYAKKGIIELHFVKINNKGQIDHAHLETLLQTYSNILVSLTHANNVIGNINDLSLIGQLCTQYQAYFHVDAVQTIGHCLHDLQSLPVHWLTASAHKLHGPKGVGFIYMRASSPIQPLIYGGAQERSMRAGTECVHNIVGLGKAMEIAYRDMDKDSSYIQGLKNYMIQQLCIHIPGVIFHGCSEEKSQSLYTILNIGLPPSEDYDMLLFNLDIRHIAASAGSACASGSNQKSHVLHALGIDERSGAIRFSFSKYNTLAEIDYTVAQLAEILTL